MNKIKTSIIIPAYNEERGIEKVIADVKKYLNQEYEIIVVNDGSTDKTKQIIEKISEINTIHHPENLGYGAALKSGIRQAQGKYVLIIDADGTYPIESISDLITHKGNYDMIVGARTGSKIQIPALRKPAKWFLGLLANYLTGVKIPDLNSGLRLMKTDVVKKFFYLLPNSFSFTVTITLALLTNNYQVKYLPINYYKRKGKSKISPIKDTIRFIQLILKTVLYFNPLKVFTFFSLLVFALAIAIGIGSILFTPKFMDITFIILSVAALQTFFFGLLAHLITKRRNES